MVEKWSLPGSEAINITDDQCCSLERAQRIIAENLRALPCETVELKEARQRVAFSDIVAVQSVPAFAESARDGYVIGSGGRGGEGAQRFRIVDEIPAGQTRVVERLAAGTACRIMTGGCVPDGSERVVPYEQCVEQDGEVLIDGHLLSGGPTFIRQPGSAMAQGETLVRSGVRLRAEHLELLSSCGVHAVAVGSRPAAGYFCTGSELQASPSGLENGQKVSSNSFLLAGILASYGAGPKDLGIVADNYPDLAAIFAQAGEGPYDVLISTGGMGPGKYDLVEQAFVDAGGQVFFAAIAMRPGKSVLFGRLGRTLFFGLPGPPHAVSALLHTLVGPALLAMQGVKDAGPKRLQAHLLHPIAVKHGNVLMLREGVLVLAGGRCSVRFAGKLEIADCYILLHPGCARFAEGELVDVYLVAGPFASP